MRYSGLGAIVAFGALSAATQSIDEQIWHIRRRLDATPRKRVANPAKKAARKRQKKARAITRAHRK